MMQFDNIRPYHDSEVAQALYELSADTMFNAVFEKLYPNPGVKDQVMNVMLKCKTIEEFQGNIIYPLLVQIEKNSTKGIVYSTMDQFHPDDCYLFISNHRDIILDSGFLNAVMHKHGFRKTGVAIGDNLLIYDWIKKLVRVNRAFIVRRNLGLREQLEASKTLSGYIRYAITQKNESVWIAQREGRTKDGNDQTQPALLKMLNMSNKASVVDGFKELNIVPMAISYEIEPCCISKVEELLNRKHNPDFAKTQQDDLRSMANGIMQPKGRVNFGFGNPLNLRIEEVVQGKNNNEAIQAIVEYIDKRIYANYKLWPNNYIAADLLASSERYKQHYSEDEKQAFVERMHTEVATLTYNSDETVELYLKIYANPVLNYARYFDIA
jgi:hypothetical protein